MKKVILNLVIVSLFCACSADKTNGTKEDNNSEATAVESAAGASSTAGASTAVESTVSVVSAAFSLQETNIAATNAKLNTTFFILLNYKG
jgi:hypothetical protein